MQAQDTTIKCLHCGEIHERLVYGKLKQLYNPTRYEHVPDWYEAQRAYTKTELLNETYDFEDDVYSDSLRNAKEFIPLGDGKLIHTKAGIHLTGNDLEGPLYIFKESNSLYTVHIEFMFRKQDKTKGAVIILSTKMNTYYVYSKTKKDCITKIRFAVEESYKLINLQ